MISVVEKLKTGIAFPWEFFFVLLNMTTAITKAAISAKPPTTPPAIAPIGSAGDSDSGMGAVVVVVVGDAELDAFESEGSESEITEYIEVPSMQDPKLYVNADEVALMHFTSEKSQYVKPELSTVIFADFTEVDPLVAFAGKQVFIARCTVLVWVPVQFGPE